MFKNIPFNRVEWVTSIFLISTAILTCTAVPWYFLTYGWDWFLFGLFIFFYLATGMSITVGYHRLFSHQAFKAKWPVKLFVLLFGAAAFENAALLKPTKRTPIMLPTPIAVGLKASLIINAKALSTREILVPIIYKQANK